MLRSFLKTLLEIESALDRIQEKAEHAMATLQSFKDLLAAVDAETTRIANKIDELVAKLEAGGMSASEEAEVQEGLTALSDRLKKIGADPAQPIPPTA